MKTARHFSRLAACTLALALSGMAPGLQAADQTSQSQSSPAYPYGPGMMGGYGGYGMGPGMMGGWGGYGMGPGMMGGYWGSMLDLTPEQQAKINKIQDETRKEHWALMGEMMNQQARLRDLNLAPKRDEAAINAVYKEFGKLQQQMYDSSIAAHKRMEAVLTKEQQEKLRSYWHRGWGTNNKK
ncbi:MAG: Spy/CpxP family protein refolding chaperone [Hyphomicrobiaceae bacterium]